MKTVEQCSLVSQYAGILKTQFQHHKVSNNSTVSTNPVKPYEIKSLKMLNEHIAILYVH